MLDSIWIYEIKKKKITPSPFEWRRRGVYFSLNAMIFVTPVLQKINYNSPNIDKVWCSASTIVGLLIERMEVLFFIYIYIYFVRILKYSNN